MLLRKPLLLFLLPFLLVSPASFAGSQDYSRLARVSLVEGHVSFQHASDVDWTAATINMPLQPEDRIYTGEDGRAEIEFDDGSVLRMAEKTDIEILALRDDFIRLRLLLGLSSLTTQGSVNFQMDTPAGAFNTLRKGDYRLDVVDNGDTDAIVRKGALQGTNSRFSQRIESGELLHVTPGDQGTHLVSRYDNRDEWDEWTDRRNADRAAYRSRGYLPDDVYVGMSDLDRYGRWVTVDGYGPGWVPSYTGAGWYPYWEGRWCYRPLWGWTWVSYEPWGWLPYHYGSWYFTAGYGWCWLPGPSYSFHFWSPGLVRFYNGSGYVSWLPLGPGDYYNVNLFYHHPRYASRLNDMRLQQRRGPEDLLNRNVPGAYRTVQTEHFTNSSLGGNRLVRLSDNDQPWKSGRMVSGQLDVSPTARSFAPAPDRPTVRPDRIERTPGTGSRSLAAPRIAPAAGNPAEPGRIAAPPADSGGSPVGRGSRIWNRSTPQEAVPGEGLGRSNQAPSVIQAPVPTNQNPPRGRSFGRALPENTDRPVTVPVNPSINERSRGPVTPGNARPETGSRPRQESAPSAAPRIQRPAASPGGERPAPAPRIEQPAPAQRPQTDRPAREDRPRPEAFASPYSSGRGWEGRTAVAPAGAFIEPRTAAPMTRGFSESRTAAPMTRGFSESRTAVPVTRGFSESRTAAPMTRGFSEPRNAAPATRGFPSAPAANGRRRH